MTRILAGVVLAVAALTVVAALRLMSGPVDLGFLKPYIARAVDAPGNDVRPDADRISLEWSALGQPIRLVFSGLKFANSEGQVLATAPMAALTFDPRSVIRGKLLPTTIVVERPVIEADIAREGGIFKRVFTSQEGGAQGEAVSILVDQLMARPNYDSLLGQLDSVLVEHAKISIRDLKSDMSWTAPDARVELRRDTAGVAISASARFTGHLDQPVDVSVSGVYTRDRSRIMAEARIDGLKPMAFAGLSPDIALLSGIDIALSGKMNIEATGTGEIRAVSFDVTGGNGHVTLPGILPKTHGVRSVNARLSVDAEAHTATLDRIDFDFGAARVLVTGAGSRTSERREFAGRAEIQHIPVDSLGDYWPLAFAEGGRDWAVENLSKGTVDVAAEFALSMPLDDLAGMKVERLVGLLDYGGMKVRYMPHMPELEDVSGKARYENGNLHFDVARGQAVGLKVAGATIELVDLDKPPPQMARLRLPISGATQDVARFLARPKLGLPKEVLYDYRRLGGDAQIDLSLSFPLINALEVDDIVIKSDATLTSLSIKDVLGAVDLTDATARIQYGDSELNVTGQGKFDGNIVDIAWREMFAAKAPFRRRYEVKGTIPASLVAKAGFPSPEPFVTGPIGTTLHYQVATNGTSEVGGRFDLKAATLAIAPIAFTKEAGAESIVQGTLKMASGGKPTIADFDGRGGGLQAKGQLRFGGDGAVQQIALQQVRLGRTDLALDWQRHPGGVDVSIRGASLELPRIYEMFKARDDVAKHEPGGAAAVSRTSSRLQLQIQNLYVKRGTLGYVNGRAELVGDRIASADMTIGGGKGTTFRVTPANQGRTLFFYVADFGTLLREAGWLDGLDGGYLHIEGRFNDMWADPPAEGTLKMGPYRMVRTQPRPDVGTLNAAIDGLSSAGNALQQFDSLSANLVKTGDRIQVRNGRTSGQSIGLTTQGTIDLGNDTAQLNGVVVPAFQLNNLLSNVPVLGPLLTGGKDGGVFAVSYQLYGPFDNLKTNVNMMSAMTPGALRDLFTSGAPAPQQSPPPPQQPPAGEREMQRTP